jgi:hypothetical protein
VHAGATQGLDDVAHAADPTWLAGSTPVTTGPWTSPNPAGPLGSAPQHDRVAR